MARSEGPEVSPVAVVGVGVTPVVGTEVVDVGRLKEPVVGDAVNLGRMISTNLPHPIPAVGVFVASRVVVVRVGKLVGLSEGVGVGTSVAVTIEAVGAPVAMNVGNDVDAIGGAVVGEDVGVMISAGDSPPIGAGVVVGATVGEVVGS